MTEKRRIRIKHNPKENRNFFTDKKLEKEPRRKPEQRHQSLREFLERKNREMPNITSKRLTRPIDTSDIHKIPSMEIRSLPVKTQKSVQRQLAWIKSRAGKAPADEKTGPTISDESPPPPQVLAKAERRRSPRNHQTNRFPIPVKSKMRESPHSGSQSSEQGDSTPDTPQPRRKRRKEPRKSKHSPRARKFQKNNSVEKNIFKLPPPPNGEKAAKTKHPDLRDTQFKLPAAPMATEHKKRKVRAPIEEKVTRVRKERKRKLADSPMEEEPRKERRMDTERRLNLGRELTVQDSPIRDAFLLESQVAVRKETRKDVEDRTIKERKREKEFREAEKTFLEEIRNVRDYRTHPPIDAIARFLLQGVPKAYNEQLRPSDPSPRGPFRCILEDLWLACPRVEREHRFEWPPPQSFEDCTDSDSDDCNESNRSIFVGNEDCEIFSEDEDSGAVCGPERFVLFSRSPGYVPDKPQPSFLNKGSQCEMNKEIKRELEDYVGVGFDDQDVSEFPTPVRRILSPADKSQTFRWQDPAPRWTPRRSPSPSSSSSLSPSPIPVQSPAKKNWFMSTISKFFEKMIPRFGR